MARSPMQQVEAMRVALEPCWKTLTAGQRAFWEQNYASEVAATDRLTDRFRSYGQLFRLAALTASAAVAAIVGFDGLAIRISAAIVGAMAVVLNGAALVFRVDQRVMANRQAEADLLAEGWLFVSGSDPFAGPPTAEGFRTFAANVTTTLKGYNRIYAATVDSPLSAGNVAGAR